MIRSIGRVFLLASILLSGVSALESQEGVTHIHEGTFDRFDVDVWVDRGEAAVYYPGERLRVYFRPTHDCYVAVFSIDTEGSVRVLYPYGYDDDPFVYGGRTRRIPDSWDHHDLLVNGPSGIEYIVAVASARPITIPHWRRYYDTRYEPNPDLIDRITGDPYEGMFHLTNLIVPVGSREQEYITNSTYFYIEQRVWYPRYMCYDCHRPRPVSFHPYVDVCLGFEIVIVDYDWYDDWAYWRPHHPPVRYRRGCWRVRRRTQTAQTTYTNERYARRRGFKNIGFSKTDVAPVDREKVRSDLEHTSDIERRRGTGRSTVPPNPTDTMKENIIKEQSPSRERSKYDAQYERRTEPTLPERKQEKTSPEDVKKRTGKTSKRQQSFWDKITDWNKKSKSTPSVSKPKSKPEEKKSSKPHKATPSKKRKPSTKSSPPKKGTSSKGRKKR
ncbi:MAG: DUF4384 domain-containing protein [Gemmatimonadota bacterium]|nr:MAG: DUF4384 domain-containing protein [Gemmatimonadota bacterium]